MITLVLGVFGMIFGSFVNALTWRLHEGKDWVNDRSECVRCHHTLAAQDLVPVVSWVWLRGKCRYCRKPIDDNPLVEVALPLLFIISYLAWPEPLHGDGLFRFVVWLVSLVGFMTLAVYDLRWFLLPNKVVFPLVGLATVQVLVSGLYFGRGWHYMAAAALGAAVIFGFFYVMFQISDGKWIGGGDVKLGIVLGLLAAGALESALVLFLASVTGLVAAIPAIVQRKSARKMHIPFGPFLLLGLFIVMLWGQAIIDWYMSLLGYA